MFSNILLMAKMNSSSFRPKVGERAPLGSRYCQAEKFSRVFLKVHSIRYKRRKNPPRLCKGTKFHTFELEAASGAGLKSACVYIIKILARFPKAYRWARMPFRQASIDPNLLFALVRLFKLPLNRY